MNCRNSAEIQFDLSHLKYSSQLIVSPNRNTLSNQATQDPIGKLKVLMELQDSFVVSHPQELQQAFVSFCGQANPCEIDSGVLGEAKLDQAELSPFYIFIVLLSNYALIEFEQKFAKTSWVNQRTLLDEASPMAC